MSKNVTVSRLSISSLAIVLCALEFHASAQALDWRRVGNSLIDRGLAGLASGAIDRVWYSSDGTKLYIRTHSGISFETSDFEKWGVSRESVPPLRRNLSVSLPEQNATGQTVPGQERTAYAIGKFAYRSNDGGRNWENLTAFRSTSILGDELADFSVNPANADEVVLASAAGVFRSMDGGKSWAGLNQNLPNLPASRFRALPLGAKGVQVDLADASVVEWQPGEKVAWASADNTALVAQLSLRKVLSAQFSSPATAVEVAGDFVYAGFADGALAVFSDGNWRRFSSPGSGWVNRIWVDSEDPRFALAVLGAPQGKILRTVNGGGFWDDLTANLAGAPIQSVTADRTSGAIYVAAGNSVYFTRTNLFALAPATPWTQVSGLPEGTVMDVSLNASGTQLWALVSGYGAFSAFAPHRQADPKIVSAADYAVRTAAPGSLMSIAGAKVNAAQAGNLRIPVLAASDQESQIQIPFEASGESLAISIDNSGFKRTLNSIPLRNSSPAIFVDKDGGPMLLDGESGFMLDAMHPARSRSRIQLLATGLGAVTPTWPTGMAAPLENPPQVSSPVRVWLDRTPLDVTRAVLAPGYVGFYLVEFEIPAIVNYGPAELYLETAGQASNRVRVYIEP